MGWRTEAGQIPERRPDLRLAMGSLGALGCGPKGAVGCLVPDREGTQGGFWTPASDGP